MDLETMATTCRTRALKQSGILICRCGSRAPGGNQNVFAIESFLDEIASASGTDPYHMRRKLLEGKPDWLKVLDTAAEKGDWGKPLPKGSGRGIAICNLRTVSAHRSPK